MKSKKKARVLLEDIRDAIEQVEKYTAEGKREFFADEKTQDALIFRIAIIGEALGKLPASLKFRYPKIAWKEAVGMRNIIIHDYSTTSINRVWDTVQKNLPALKTTVEVMLIDLKQVA